MIIISEFLGVSLFYYLKERKFNGLGLDLVQSVLFDVLSSLSIIHRHGLVHCDIKPENILQVTLRSSKVKLIDFGCCTPIDDCKGNLQTPFYRAPEVILRLKCDTKIDIWSVGCVAAELFLGLPIFLGNDDLNLIYLHNLRLGPLPKKMIDASEKRDLYFNKDGNMKSKEELEMLYQKPFQNQSKIFIYERLEAIIENYPFASGSRKEYIEREKERRVIFLDLLKMMLKLDPDERISADEALTHPFFSIKFEE